MKIPVSIAFLLMLPMAHAVEWSIEQCSALDLLAGRTGIADVRPSNDPHQNSDLMMEQNSGIYRGQWSWQSEMPELLYGMMQTGDAAQVSPSGFTALQAACVYADENIFRALMEAGVPVDTRPGDWPQLGYVGDTPLGLLIRFMTPRTAAVRVRMARELLEKGADPDAPMTTWKGNRVVTSVPFCELGRMECNHEMRLLLLQYGEQDLRKRMAAWQLSWDAYRSDLLERLEQGGVRRKQVAKSDDTAQEQADGKVPLLDLIRRGDVEGVRLALEAGASIEVSPRARRYGQEPLFNIPARKKDSPEDAVEIARLLVEAGADVNDLNRRGRSLRIHYDRFYSKASRALCAYFKSCGSQIHPDSPVFREQVEKSRQEARERAAAFAARLVAEQSGSTSSQPESTEPAPQQPQPTQPEPTGPAPLQPQLVQPEDAESEARKKALMAEVQNQLIELQTKLQTAQKNSPDDAPDAVEHPDCEP